jgi:hypothetical protein
MALSQEELKIVEQMKQMGATNAQISGFIGKGRLGLTPTFPVERVQEQRNELGLVESRFSETGKDIAQMFDGLMATAKKTYAKQKEALGASMDGQQGIGRGFAQAVGIGAGGVSEGIGEVVKGGVKVALSQEQEESLKSGIGKVVKPIAESKTLKALIEKYESLSDEQKRDVQAIGGGLMFGADVLGLGVGGKAVKEGTKAIKQIPKFFPEGQVLKNADEVIDFVAKTEKVTEPVEKTAKNLSKSEVDLPQMTLQEKWIGLEPSFKKKIQNQPEKMQEYINVVKARNNDLDMPSVYEYAGDNARIAVADMERILNSQGSKIGQTRTKLGSYTLDIDQIKAIDNAFKNKLAKLNLNVVEGRIIKDSGRISMVSNSEINALAELYEGINVLKRSPNLTNAIDLRNVFDNKINFGKSAREISGILDPVSRATRAEIATQAAKLVGKTGAKDIADYSDFMKAYEGLKSFTDRNAGGEYLLRVFMSGRGGEASDVIKTIANYTGKDLSVDAVMMTLVTDLMGNSTQKNLFRQEITKAGIDAARILSGDPTGAIPLVAEFAKKRLLDPEDILKTASGVKKKFDPTKQGGFVKNVFRGEGGEKAGQAAIYGNGKYVSENPSVAKQYGKVTKSQIETSKFFDATKALPDDITKEYASKYAKEFNIPISEVEDTIKSIRNFATTPDYYTITSNMPKPKGVDYVKHESAAANLLNGIIKQKGFDGVKGYELLNDKATKNTIYNIFPKSKVNESVSSLNDSIKQAKASGQSFDEWVKTQTDPLSEFKTGVGIKDPDIARGTVKEAINDIGGIKNVERGTVDINRVEKTESINTRSERYKKVEQDVKDGTITPIIVDDYLQVMDGHHRLEVYRSMGMKEIPVIAPKGTDGVSIKSPAQLKAEWDKVISKKQPK